MYLILYTAVAFLLPAQAFYQPIATLSRSVLNMGIDIISVMIMKVLLYVFLMYTAVVNLLPAYLLFKAIADLFIGAFVWQVS